ncbi:lipid-transfer protein [Streptomyces sp. NPDC046909]|uniref:thiolase C-terminal domain-containing protein n=1 Tax=Streptomyces sp. NPDC046909 TaxID=3155617 RepID=UPI0033C741E3
MTELSRRSGRTETRLAVEAGRHALADARLEASAVDAVLTYHLGSSAPVNHVAAALGVHEPAWTNELYGGGTQAASILGDAAMLIESGIASTVLVYRALNGRSGNRMGQVALRLGASGDEQFTLPYGMLGPVHLFALAAQRWMYETKSTEDDLAAVVIRSRAHATSNPRAVMRTPVGPIDYRASPYIATPLRRLDCCLETDGATALVVTRADIADRVRPGSPRIHAVVRGGGPGASAMDKAADLGRIFASHLAEPLYAAAGMTPRDVDVAQLYDAYSFLVLRQLEDFGFCGPGEAGEFVRQGQTGPSGRLPVNLNGGLLSEGYVHGLNNVAEAVRQLRGDSCLPASDAEVALCTGFGGSYGSAAVLVRG